MTTERHRVTWLDVFAARPMEGTLHLVVHGADDVPDHVMATLAFRARLSETSFLQTATVPGATYRHRIYTVGGEIPFAGHPSLGAAAAHAWATGDHVGEVTQQTLAGQQRLWFELGPASGRVTIRQNPVELLATLDAPPVLAMLGLPAGAGHADLPVQVATTGLTTLLVPLASADDLARIAVDWPAFRATVAPHGKPESVNCYVVAPLEDGRTWGARCFSLDVAGNEDPATGSAAGPLGGYLRHHLGIEQVEIRQGREMGSPSELSVSTRDGIDVGGTVWLLGTGELSLPPR